MALALSSDFGALSVAAAAVPLAVLEVVVCVLEDDCVVLIETVAEADSLVALGAELFADTDADDTTSLVALGDATEMLEDGTAVVVSNVDGVGVGALGSVGTGTGGMLVARLDWVSDRLGIRDVLSRVGVEASALDNSVEMALTVAVMVSAILGMAPYTPSQMVYPLRVSMSAPKQLEITHCKDPSPRVKPEVVLVVQRKSMSAVEEHV